jgi:hypothetical protein
MTTANVSPVHSRSYPRGGRYRELNANLRMGDAALGRKILAFVRVTPGFTTFRYGGQDLETAVSLIKNYSRAFLSYTAQQALRNLGTEETIGMYCHDLLQALASKSANRRLEDKDIQPIRVAFQYLASQLKPIFPDKK